MHEEHALYTVIANPEDELAIWPAERRTPPVWRPIGCTGTFDVCFEWVTLLERDSARAWRHVFEQAIIRP